MLRRLTTLTLALFVAATLGVVGCTSEHDHDHDHGTEGHEHDDEGGDDGDGGGEHGTGHSLGTLTIGGTELAVVQLGALAAGQESAFEFEIASGPAPAAIRTWVGTEDGRGAMKALAEAEGDVHAHAHIELPAELSPTHRLWVEVEDAAGSKTTGSVELHRD